MCYADGTLSTEKLFLLKYVLFLYGLGVLFPVFLFLLLELIHADRDQYQQQWRIQDFPDGGWGRQPLTLGQKSIILQHFCRKLHENERN